MAVRWGGVIMGPTTDMGTNEGWPIWGGKTRPNQGITIKIDDTTHVLSADENGVWSFTPPEPLSNGEHRIEMHTRDLNSGNIGEGGESFTIDVRRDPMGEDWNRDQHAHQQWEEWQRDAFHEANATPPQAGGGEQQQTGGSGSGSSGETGTTGDSTAGSSGTGSTSQTGGSGGGSSQTDQGGGGGAPPSEKGNAQKPTSSADKGVGGVRNVEPAPPPSEKGNAPRR